jgi:hypothetical protein
VFHRASPHSPKVFTKLFGRGGGGVEASKYLIFKSETNFEEIDIFRKLNYEILEF